MRSEPVTSAVPRQNLVAKLLCVSPQDELKHWKIAIDPGRAEGMGQLVVATFMVLPGGRAVRPARREAIEAMASLPQLASVGRG